MNMPYTCDCAIRVIYMLCSFVSQGLGRDCVAEHDEVENDNCTMLAVAACSSNGNSSDAVENCTAVNGDGLCDFSTGCNTLAYDWDGGDCCASTCSLDGSTCAGPYVCLNPNALENLLRTTSCNVLPFSWVGDGYCDGYSLAFGDETYNLNTDGCGWDGGDCCLSTCSDCANVNESKICIDPNATENANLPQGCAGLPFSWLGDHECDAVANTEACGWDGGDCCSSTCLGCTSAACSGYSCDYWVAGGYSCDNLETSYACDCSGCNCDPQQHFCGMSGFSCQNPDSEEAQQFDAACAPTGAYSWIGDGYCDASGGFNVEVWSLACAAFFAQLGEYCLRILIVVACANCRLVDGTEEIVATQHVLPQNTTAVTTGFIARTPL